MANSSESPKPELKLSTSNDAWLLSLISSAELLKPGPELTSEAKALTLLLWEQVCTEIGKDRFQQAYLLALRSSTYRPDIAEICRFAGLRYDPPSELEARAALRWLIENMRYHGRRFARAWPLKGERLLICDYEKADRNAEGIPAPKPSEAIEAVLLELGLGDRQTGLDLVWSHSALDTVRSGDEMDRLPVQRQREGEKIEKRWVESWLRVGA